MNIMIVTNRKYLDATYVMLTSLFHHHQDVPMDIYLPYEDLGQEDRDKLEHFVENYFQKQIHYLYVGTSFKERVVSKSGINVETYYRILGMELLPKEVERILYLDVDMVICGSLKGMYEMPLENAPLAACEDIYGKVNGFHEENKARLGIPKEYSYFNAGVLLLNMTYLREVNGAECMLRNIYENYDRYFYNDQDVMNEMFFDTVCYIGWDEYNCPPAWYYVNRKKMLAGELEFLDYSKKDELHISPEEFADRYINLTEQIYENAKIIHYLGATKPWLEDRKEAAVYELFDRKYWEVVEKCRNV